MKFLHTSDWQIGMSAGQIGEAGPPLHRVHDERLHAARRVIDAARVEGVGFVLVAGDTFEDNGVDRLLIRRVADILASAPCPVYLIPGNHDPLAPGSVWEHPVWQSFERIHILREDGPIDVPGGTLYGCPCHEAHSGKDPTAWIAVSTDPPPPTPGPRLGLAHGTVEGVNRDEPDYPIPRDAAARVGLDYLALGHWHSTATYPSADGALRMAYSGTHETTKFGERDSGNALVVEIAGPGAAPVLKTVHTGGLVWLTFDRDLRVPGDLAQLRAELEGLAARETTLVSVRLTGILPAGDREELRRIEELLASRFLFSRLDSCAARPAPDDDAWVEALPAGVLREAARRLRDLANPGYAGARPDGATPAAATRALLELFAVSSGGSHAAAPPAGRAGPARSSPAPADADSVGGGA